MVVYDQSTRDVTGLAADSFLSILLGKLDSCFHSVSILTGRRALGYRFIWCSCLYSGVMELWPHMSVRTRFPGHQWLWWQRAALRVD